MTDMTMPKFSANLGFLWTDRPLLDRITAAASAGFKAVELHWPYDIPAELVRNACDKHGLALLGINTPVDDTTRVVADLVRWRGGRRISRGVFVKLWTMRA